MDECFALVEAVIGVVDTLVETVEWEDPEYEVSCPTDSVQEVVTSIVVPLVTVVL